MRTSAGKSVVHAAAGAAQPLGIVDDERAAQLEAPPEVDERRAGVRRALADGVVAQEHDVEGAERVLLDDGLVGAEGLGEVGRARVAAGAHAGRDAEDVVVVEKRQIVDGDEAHLVAAAVRREAEVDGRERRLLIADGGDDEADAHD